MATSGERAMKSLQSFLDRRIPESVDLSPDLIKEFKGLIGAIELDFSSKIDERRALELQRDAFEAGVEALEHELVEISYHPQSVGIFNPYEADLARAIDQEQKAAAKPVPPKLNEYSASEQSLIKSILIESMHRFEPDDLVPSETVYCWLTECWNCAEESYVWMQSSTLAIGLSIPKDEDGVTKDNLRRVYSDFDARAALTGPVTTKEGGSYFGFSCHSCDSVLGAHYLKREAYSRLLRGTMDEIHLSEA